MRRVRRTTAALFGLGFALGVGAAQAPEPAPRFAGTWRATLTTPGGDLPFTLRIDAGSPPTAVVVNGSEQARFDSATIEGRRLALRFDVYDSEIRAELSADGRRLAGEWVRPGRPGVPFAATLGDTRRFLPLVNASDDDARSVAGAWAATFDTGERAQAARGELAQEGRRVVGTFLTPVGDQRYLEGEFQDGLLRLSTFDGGHAILSIARLREDGTLAGEIWRGPGKGTPWTARPLAPGGDDGLPDAFAQAGLAGPDGQLRFRFDDLQGRPVSPSDERFRGRVLLVNIFGSWCPNCNDEAPLLRELARRYRDRGLEIVGLAYERTGEREVDRRSVERFARHHGIDYPLLLAGIDERKAAAATLPDLTGLFAFPTTIFIDRGGRVRKIHSGFTGPATGKHHDELVAEFHRLIEELLAEPAPAVADSRE